MRWLYDDGYMWETTDRKETVWGIHKFMHFY